MTSEPAAPAATRSGGPDWYRVDHVIMQARRERALWLRDVIRGIFARIGLDRLSTTLSGWRRGRSARADVEELLMLGDRTLADIGLRREDLWAVRHGRTTLSQLLEGRDDERTAELLTFQRPVAVRVAPADLERAA